MLKLRSPAVCALSGSRKTATGLINSDVTALYQSQIRRESDLEHRKRN